MLDGGIIQRLLEEKWKTFARNQFLKRLLILLVHLLFLSLAVYLRPDDPDIPLLEYSDDVTVIVRFICEVCTVLCVLSYVILQQGDEIRNQGFWAFLKQQYNSPPKAIFLVSNLLILACIFCRVYGDRDTEEAILCFAVPGSWFLLMFFAGAVRLTGPFVTMIYSMITGDMLTFSIIYSIVLFGFSQSFFFLYKGFPNAKNSLYQNYVSTWMALFQITLGNYDYSELSMTTYPGLSKAVFGLFMVFVPILLLNMLIAMMGNTYAHVIEQSEKEWMKQWAKIVITLERAVPQSDAHLYLQEYSISLGPSEDPSTEQRGVMVIKSKSKTRAKQRKGAVANWKRVGKVTINALKKRGLTGEEMRCLMWGRESINTPIKKKGSTLNPQDHNMTGAFGGALTAALDVMAFTHDIDINKASGTLEVQNKASVNTVINKQINTLSNITTPKPAVSTIFGTLTQIPDNTNLLQDAKPNIADFLKQNNQPKPVSSETEDIDPLRELVLCSKDKCETEKLQDLAVKAANITNAQEITLKPNISVKNVAGIFAGTGAFVKKVEQTIKKKYSTLDPSDSDGFGEGPLLGRVSRMRRAKSANSKPASAKSKFSEKRQLFNESESSSSDTITNTAASKEDKRESLDYVEERIRHVRECLRVTSTDEKVQSLRPYNIDVALGNDTLLVALSEPTARSENISTHGSSRKHKRKKRPKTAKANRVSPFVDVMPRGCESANNKVYSEPDSPPDPLEPWSMKGIVTMNKILAWENDQDSL